MVNALPWDGWLKLRSMLLYSFQEPKSSPPITMVKTKRWRSVKPRVAP